MCLRDVELKVEKKLARKLKQNLPVSPLVSESTSSLEKGGSLLKKL